MRNAAAIQRALYTALDGNVGATVTSDPAEDQAAPYVVLGELTETPDDAHDHLGTEETATLHVWSRVKGSGQVLAIMAAVDVALHHQVLSLQGGGTVQVAREFAEVLKDETEPGETWRHGVLRYRVKTLEPVP